MRRNTALPAALVLTLGFITVLAVVAPATAKAPAPEIDFEKVNDDGCLVVSVEDPGRGDGIARVELEVVSRGNKVTVTSDPPANKTQRNVRGSITRVAFSYAPAFPGGVEVSMCPAKAKKWEPFVEVMATDRLEPAATSILTIDMVTTKRPHPNTNRFSMTTKVPVPAPGCTVTTAGTSNVVADSLSATCTNPKAKFSDLAEVSVEGVVADSSKPATIVLEIADHVMIVNVPKR